MPGPNFNELFGLIIETIIKNSNYSREMVLSRFERFKHFDFETFNDQYLYQVLAYIPFYAGMKAKTVTNKIETIKEYFPDYKTVSQYNESDINRMLADSKMIRHKEKIKAAISNAKRVKSLVERHGSFKDYLRSLNFNRSPEDLEIAADRLKNTFSYLGEATVHHFLTDIGAKTIKPDRVIMRVFTRLGLVANETCLDDARLVCNRFVEETGYSHRYVDIVIVKLGHIEDDLDIGLPQGICLEKEPGCGKCLVKPRCFYRQS
jgi:DNA-3-methyladenine glycosylase I